MSERRAGNLQSAQVPVEHRLREVPISLRMLVETDTWSSNTPVGHWCHEAADEIERLRAAIQSQETRAE
jgi:hypothetical protein